MVDLVGRFSNHDLTALFQRLTTRDWKQAGQQHVSARGTAPAPDGRLKFGLIRDSIIAVLEQADDALRVQDIYAGVEKRLGEPVSRGSVKGYLHSAKRRKTPLFEYCGRLGYRLLTHLADPYRRGR
jgi:hypothetical protein